MALHLFLLNGAMNLIVLCILLRDFVFYFYLWVCSPLGKQILRHFSQIKENHKSFSQLKYTNILD